MIPIFIALAVLLGAGGTVAVSDAARPGDILFPVDRAVEEVRFALTPGGSKAELTVEFAQERLDEVDSILQQEHATSTASTEVSTQAQSNLSQALDILTNHLAEIRGLASTTPGIEQAISAIEARLLAQADALPQELRLRIRDEGGRFELRTEDQKLKVKIDDGKIEVEFESEDGDDDGSDNDGDGDGNSGPGSSNSGPSGGSGGSSSSGALEIEADVFTDTTIVVVEQNDQKSSFSTSAKTRAAVMAEILARYPLLTQAQIEVALSLEVEDRASRPEDSDTSGSGDDDSSDDNSGSGSGGNNDSDDDDSGSDDNSGSGSSGSSGGSN